MCLHPKHVVVASILEALFGAFINDEEGRATINSSAWPIFGLISQEGNISNNASALANPAWTGLSGFAERMRC